MKDVLYNRYVQVIFLKKIYEEFLLAASKYMVLITIQKMIMECNYHILKYNA